MTQDQIPLAADAEDFCDIIMRRAIGGITDDAGTVNISAIQRWAGEVRERLTAAGLNPYEPVLVPIGARAEDVAAIIGVILADGVAVPVHVNAHANTLAQVQAATKARFQVRMPDREGRGSPRLKTLLGHAPAPRELLRGAAMITFTSGSTGQPKGVVLSRRRMSAKFHSILQKIGLPIGAVTAVPLQLTFSFGQWAAFVTLMQGGTVLMSARFDPNAIAKALAEGACQYIAAVPTMLRMLPAGNDSASAMTILTGGEAVSADLRQQLFGQWRQARIFSIYGLTETGTCDVYHEDTAVNEPTHSLGLAAPGVTLKTDPATSELLIQTPFAMLGYLDMPEQSAITLGNGWLRSGDLAQVAPNGEVRFLGRLKELINRAGNKISPLEVETLFLRHPAISAALATGIADERVGEAIHLLIVLKSETALTEAELLRWAGPQIEPFKMPDKIHFADSLPLGRTGKADRGALRRTIEEKQ